MNDKLAKESSELFYNILSGGLAGTCSTSIVYPLDLARTRLGVDLGRTKSERQFTGLVDCLGKVKNFKYKCVDI